ADRAPRNRRAVLRSIIFHKSEAVGVSPRWRKGSLPIIVSARQSWPCFHIHPIDVVEGKYCALRHRLNQSGVLCADTDVLHAVIVRQNLASRISADRSTWESGNFKSED